ncbi:ribonuclease H-like domain, reverse transcriptase, RNA-dependent DNA polymerase [Tanacetum coccineum]
MTGKKNKEIGSATSFQCPMLNNSNFNILAIRMQVILEANDLWEVVEPQPTTQIENKADKTAIAFIFQALPEDQILQIVKHKYAKTVWDALKTRHVRENRISSITSRATNVGLTFEDATLVQKLLTAVPDRFLHIVASIEQYSNLDNMSLDESIRRLKTFEERLKCKKERQPDSQERLMFSQHDSQGKTFRAQGNYKGKSNQENNYRSDKKNRESSQNNFKKDKRKFVRNLSKTRCYKCKKLGHYARNCTQKNPEEDQSNLIEEDLEPTLLMATIEEHHEVFLNERNFEQPKTSPGEESLWYLDNGASNHMTGVKEHFKEIDEKITGNVRFGDGSYVEIKGKGSILLECKNKEQRAISQIGKHSRAPFPQQAKYRSKTALDVIYRDLCGPISPPTPSGKRYGRENGIMRQLIAPYLPQQNGVVERKNRTILSTTRCMMKATGMPQNFWAEAVRHAILLLNCTPTKSLEDVTPYEALKGRKPNLQHIRIFGCIAYAKVPSQHLTKLDDRSIQMVYLGSEPGSKAYRLFDPITKKICVSRDVKFKEDETWNWEEYVKDFDPKEPEWSDFIIQNNETQETEEVQQDQENEIEDDVFTDNENEETPSPTNSPPNTPSTISHSDTSEYSPIQSINFSPNSQTATPSTTDTDVDHIPTRGYRTLNEVYDNTERLLLVEDEPKNFKEASKDEKWIEAMQVEIDSINKNNTWKLTTLPKDHKAIGLKWVFKTKRDANGEILKHKARLVAKGYIQEHGIDFDEVFAPVARIETIRLILALAAYNKWEVHHLDVKSAFLHGDLKEEVYVSQPDGFIKTEDKGKVYRLRKALYGLRQAPRAWYTKLDKTLKLLKFKKCALEQAVYTRTDKTSTLLIGVYVDDLIVTGTSKKEIESFKYQMQEQFEMSDLGLLAYYLGIEVTQKWGEISIKQTGYATKILKDTGMLECNDAKIPMEPGLKLTKLSKEKFVDPTEYQSIIGCLRYLLHTRPDLSFLVGLLSRFMQEPQEQHMKAIKQVLRYIKGTKDYGITYGHDGNKIQGYSDSSYGVNTQEGKGTTRIVFYFGNSPITWSTQKQGIVALSSCESEFIVATAAATQALWLKRLLSKITDSNKEKITIYVENKSGVALMKNPVFHGRSKHIDTKYHFIRECVEKEDLTVEYISGEQQRADILTKALPRIRFVTMRQILGVKNLLQHDQD